MKTLIAFVIVALLACCTDNQKARNYGGTEEIQLPKGERLMMATWKGAKGGADLWYLTEPMPEGYTPTRKTFRESSDYGVWEGTVIFIESK